ncbi:MAG: 50S ribosomal protein L25/general stress protein Ctc [Sneathiellaceae bacterium]
MSEAAQMAAQARSKAGKGTARALRREGRIPAVIYGDKKDPESISVDFREIQKMIEQGHVNNQIYEINLDSGKHVVLARDVQLDPVTDWPIHVDFLRVGASSRIQVDVPVHFLNHEKSPGLKRGGVLNVVRHELELYCPAMSIPHQIDIDLSKAEIGDSIHISSVSLPDGVDSVITDRDFTIATIAAPSVMPEGADDVDDEAAEKVAPEPDDED